MGRVWRYIIWALTYGGPWNAYRELSAAGGPRIYDFGHDRPSFSHRIHYAARWSARLGWMSVWVGEWMSVWVGGCLDGWVSG